MSKLINQVALAMVAYERGNQRRINHFLRVHSYAEIIAEAENVDADTLKILKIAALMHDIGIKVSLEKYNNAGWQHQQEEGPIEAEPILRRLNCPAGIRERVLWLIAHHHETEGVEDIDHQILLEADYLVNAIDRGRAAEDVIKRAEEFYQTKTAWLLLKSLLGAGA